MVSIEAHPWRETFWEIFGIAVFTVALLIGAEMGRPEPSLGDPPQWPLYWLKGTVAAGGYGIGFCVTRRDRWKISPAGCVCVLIASFGWFLLVPTPLVGRGIYLYFSLPVSVVLLFTHPFGLSRAISLYLATAFVGLDFLIDHRTKEMWHLAYFALPIVGMIKESTHAWARSRDSDTSSKVGAREGREAAVAAVRVEGRR